MPDYEALLRQMSRGSMHLTFLGTGTSMGVPVIGCSCPVCTSPDPHNRRMRVSALLHAAGKHILFDVGPDFRTQALTFGVRCVDAVLLTHSHQDHIAGLDDLRPIIRPGNSMPLYGNAATLRDVKRRYSYAFDNTSDGSSRPSFELFEVQREQPFTLEHAGTPLEVLPFDVHHGSWVITGYRIGRLGYVTDASSLPPESMALLHDLDVLVLNALRFVPHYTHFSLDQALGLIAELQPRRAFLVHMNHDLDHATVNARLPRGVALAHDGLQVEIADH
jgi:phosphoribosyl 1,2-cyclic phosphate phosphodiesterase